MKNFCLLTKIRQMTLRQLMTTMTMIILNFRERQTKLHSLILIYFFKFKLYKKEHVKKFSNLKYFVKQLLAGRHSFGTEVGLGVLCSTETSASQPLHWAGGVVALRNFQQNYFYLRYQGEGGL